MTMIHEMFEQGLVVQWSDYGNWCVKPVPGQIVADLCPNEGDLSKAYAFLFSVAPRMLKVLEEMENPSPEALAILSELRHQLAQPDEYYMPGKE
jgi:hypothetical protein